MQGFAAIIASVTLLAATVTKITDFVRNATGSREPSIPKWVWNVVPEIVGVAFAWGWQQNLSQDLLNQIPAFAGKTIGSTAGYILTGLVIGGVAGGLHEVFDALSGIASQTHAVADEQGPDGGEAIYPVPEDGGSEL